MGVLSCVGAVPGGKPFETFGKDSIMLRRRKHGTTGQLALPHQHRQKGEIAETVRSAPGRDPRMARFIRVFGALARLLAARSRLLAAGSRLLAAGSRLLAAGSRLLAAS
jgi:hypothetical protein